MAKHNKATVVEYSSKVSQIEIKVQEYNEKMDLIVDKVNKDYVKRQELDNIGTAGTEQRNECRQWGIDEYRLNIRSLAQPRDNLDWPSEVPVG